MGRLTVCFNIQHFFFTDYWNLFSFIQLWMKLIDSGIHRFSSDAQYLSQNVEYKVAENGNPHLKLYSATVLELRYLVQSTVQLHSYVSYNSSLVNISLISWLIVR